MTKAEFEATAKAAALRAVAAELESIAIRPILDLIKLRAREQEARAERAGNLEALAEPDTGEVFVDVEALIASLRSLAPEQRADDDAQPAAWLVPKIVEIDRSVRQIASPQALAAVEGEAAWKAEIFCDTEDRPRIDKHGVAHYPKPLGLITGLFRANLCLHLPPEFLSLCAAHKFEPAEVLRGFIADLCGIISYARTPRQDGYNSNGSDERDLARQWYDRAGYSWARTEYGEAPPK